MSLGKKLQDLRNNKGITQKELAEMMGIGQSTIAMYETDKREPDLATLAQFVNFYNISFNEILSYLPTPNHPETPDSSPAVTPDDRKLLDKINNLSDRDKAIIRAVIEVDTAKKENAANSGGGK